MVWWGFQAVRSILCVQLAFFSVFFLLILWFCSGFVYEFLVNKNTMCFNFPGDHENFCFIVSLMWAG